MEDNNFPSHHLPESSNKAGYTIAWIAIIVVIVGIYYLFVSRPNNEIQKIQLQESYTNQRVENNRNNLTNCLNAVDERIKKDVLEWCKTSSQLQPNLPNEKFITLGANCSFPEKLIEPFVQGWEKQKKEGREECYRLYPQN